jgi:hypothetical protein
MPFLTPGRILRVTIGARKIFFAECSWQEHPSARWMTSLAQLSALRAVYSQSALL